MIFRKTVIEILDSILDRHEATSPDTPHIWLVSEDIRIYRKDDASVLMLMFWNGNSWDLAVTNKFAFNTCYPNLARFPVVVEYGRGRTIKAKELELYIGDLLCAIHE